MQLVFELCSHGPGMPGATRNKVFDGAGGVIGRGADCDWVIADHSRQLSSHHALVSFRDGQYFLTDISSNGICLGTAPCVCAKARLGLSPLALYFAWARLKFARSWWSARVVRALAIT